MDRIGDETRIGEARIVDEGGSGEGKGAPFRKILDLPALIMDITSYV